MIVMIVDDDKRIREMMMSILGGTTFDFLECATGGEAVEAYPAHRPDWVLMDIMMNGMDGLSATREIVHSFPGARILIVTQYNDPDLREEAKMAGAIGYVMKENLTEVFSLMTAS